MGAAYDLHWAKRHKEDYLDELARHEHAYEKRIEERNKSTVLKSKEETFDFLAAGYKKHLSLLSAQKDLKKIIPGASLAPSEIEPEVNDMDEMVKLCQELYDERKELGMYQLDMPMTEDFLQFDEGKEGHIQVDEKIPNTICTCRSKIYRSKSLPRYFKKSEKIDHRDEKYDVINFHRINLEGPQPKENCKQRSQSCLPTDEDGHYSLENTYKTFEYKKFCVKEHEKLFSETKDSGVYYTFPQMIRETKKWRIDDNLIPQPIPTDAIHNLPCILCHNQSRYVGTVEKKDNWNKSNNIYPLSNISNKLFNTHLKDNEMKHCISDNIYPLSNIPNKLYNTRLKDNEMEHCSKNLPYPTIWSQENNKDTTLLQGQHRPFNMDHNSEYQKDSLQKEYISLPEEVHPSHLKLNEFLDNVMIAEDEQLEKIKNDILKEYHINPENNAECDEITALEKKLKDKRDGDYMIKYEKKIDAQKERFDYRKTEQKMKLHYRIKPTK